MREDRNCQWRVAARPEGNVRLSDFEYREEPVPVIGDGEFLLRTLYLGLRPVMRMYLQGRAVAGERPLAMGDILHGRGVAEVVESRHPDYRPGDVVHGQIGWQTWKASRGTAGERFIRMNHTDLPLSLGAGVLGMNGFSAWTGFTQCASPRPGDVVVVSAAAGGVGSTVIQIARIMGCRVIGIAGGPAKCALIRELGCEHSIDYRHDDLPARLTELCPDGIDIYFDNVGGDTLCACLDRLAMNARIVLCGSISEYTRTEPWGPPNYTRLRAVNGRMQGFFVYNFARLFGDAERDLATWVREGRLRPVQDIVEGFENMPAALARLYSGENVGVQICRVRGERP
ncbi:MAG: NADP-dependent oxidoreductase [Gammaproteobacteria bacterium]|nr:NADP-dependent oxidoreductase [Gammaproteobacteria bacterium]